VTNCVENKEFLAEYFYCWLLFLKWQNFVTNESLWWAQLEYRSLDVGQILSTFKERKVENFKNLVNFWLLLTYCLNMSTLKIYSRKKFLKIWHKNPLYESCWILFGLPSGKNCPPKLDTPNFKTLCMEK
jgi:hypothetical protein